MGYEINLPPIASCGPHAFGFFDDFFNYTTADLWTLLGDVGSTAAVGDAAGGVLTCTGDGTDNDFSGIATTAELFKVAANKPLMAQARITFTEAATNEAGVVFGFAQEATTEVIADATGEPVGTLDGALIYKPMGNGVASPAGTRWKVCSSNATTQTITDTEHTRVSGTAATLKIEINPITSTDAEVTYWIDLAGGLDFQQMRENGSNPRTPAIKHTLTITNMDEMHLICGIKNGTAAAESLLIDYISAWQKR